jgi:hypothetical protein
MGTSDEWAEDGSPAGGVGTITRPATEPGERARPRPAGPPDAVPRRTHRPRRPSRGGPGWGAPFREPKGAPPDDPTREPKGAPPDDRGAVKRGFIATREEGGRKAPGGERGQQSERGKQGQQRMPFFLLLCGLLGGALVCALVISTTLAEGSFQITRLQQSNTALAKQRQLLQQQVAAAQSAQVIEARARQLGMLSVGELRFLNLKTGKIQTDAGSGAVQDIHVPGYTP